MSEHLLVTLGKQALQNKNKDVQYVSHAEANTFIKDLTKHPHAFVLGCCMDRQITSEKAWMIPYIVGQVLGDFSFKALTQLSLEDIKNIFNEHKLHRYNDIMAEVFYKAVQRIQNEYGGDASKIWAGSPGSATVVYRFLHFDGVGVKIATMAANILARDFNVPMSDYCSIDVSPDVHVKRVMYRAGLVDEQDADNNLIIYKARELCPEFPGIIDSSLWEIGRNWCHPTSPDCDHCILADECKKRID